MQLVMALAVALLANGDFSEVDGKGRPVGWAVDRTHWSVAKGVAPRALDAKLIAKELVRQGAYV